MISVDASVYFAAGLVSCLKVNQSRNAILSFSSDSLLVNRIDGSCRIVKVVQKSTTLLRFMMHGEVLRLHGVSRSFFRREFV